MSSSCDFLVIGAGSAGCAVARQLSDDPANRVTLLEAGGHNREWDVRVPAAGLRLINDPQHDWCYRTEPDPSRGGTVDNYYRGKGLGGSSAINGMVYVRGAASDFDRWAAEGATGWSWAEVEPAYRAMERGDGKRERSTGRHVATTTLRQPQAATSAFMDAAEANGLRRLADYNGAQQEGIGLIELTQRRGLRWSSANAFLDDVRRRPNLSVMTGCEVERLIVEANVAKGALVRRGQEVKEVHAANVILCAGTLNTPKILMLSGVGDAATLRDHGIAPVLHSPSVGANLREHPLVRLQYATRIATYNDAHRSWRTPGHVLRYLLHREGPLAGVFQAAAFFRTRPDKAVPDSQLHFLPIAVAQDNEGNLERSSRQGASIYVNVSHPRSTGRVALASADPAAAPQIHYRLAGDDGDVEQLVDAMAFVQRVARTPPFAGLVDAETMPGFDVASDRPRAQDYVRGHIEPAYHPVGTCTMGRGNDAVVTPDLKVVGIDRLWIADASVMPSLISGNTNAACMMIGYRLGEMLRQRARAA
jgi:choline dehydrogenase